MGESQPDWAPVYTFTGLETHYPLELFIATVEHQHRGPKTQLREAWKCLSDDRTTPVGQWKKSAGRYKTIGTSDIYRWTKLKFDLLNTFGRRGAPYSLEDKLEFLLSLNRYGSEPYSSLLHRVQWVMANVVQTTDPGLWTTMLFLQGLSNEDRTEIISQISDHENEADCADTLKNIVKALDGGEGWDCSEVETSHQGRHFLLDGDEPVGPTVTLIPDQVQVKKEEEIQEDLPIVEEDLVFDEESPPEARGPTERPKYLGKKHPNLKAAVEAVQSGQMAPRRAAKVYGVPRSTIRNYVNRPPEMSPQVGYDKRNILTYDEERTFARLSIERESQGRALTKKELQEIVYQHLCITKGDTDKEVTMPTMAWITRMCKRNPDLITIRQRNLVESNKTRTHKHKADPLNTLVPKT